VTKPKSLTFFHVHDSAHDLLVFENVGDSLPTHYHPYYHHTLVVSGKVEVTVDDEPKILEAGERLLVERSHRHSIRALTPGATILHIYEPSR
jgi:quercetin dioxygenase-like cupin family protein